MVLETEDILFIVHDAALRTYSQFSGVGEPMVTEQTEDTGQHQRGGTEARR